MYLIISKDNVIVASCDFEPDEEDCQSRGERIIEIDDSEFKDDMIGAIYNGG